MKFTEFRYGLIGKRYQMAWPFPQPGDESLERQEIVELFESGTSNARVPGLALCDRPQCCDSLTIYVPVDPLRLRWTEELLFLMASAFPLWFGVGMVISLPLPFTQGKSVVDWYMETVLSILQANGLNSYGSALFWWLIPSILISSLAAVPIYLFFKRLIGFLPSYILGLLIRR